MNRIYRAVIAWLTARLDAPACIRDELPGLSAEDWADLPPHHPASDSPCGC